MAGKANRAGRSLREKAEQIGRRTPGYRSRVDTLLDAVSDEDREEILSLLKDEPLLPHGAVAQVLCEEWPELTADEPISDRNVLDWRHARNIRLRPRR